MEQTVTIVHRFVSLNEYVDRERANRYAAASIKKKETSVAEEAMKELQPIDEPCHIRFVWHLTNKRRDLDNIAFAKKFILDGAVKAGILENDGVKYITSFEDSIAFGEEEKVEVTFRYG